MAGTTNVPSISWSSAGPVAPSAQQVLAGYQADVTAAFGYSFNYNLNTPQGQLSTSGAAAIDNQNQVIVWVATQLDPATATGRFQDAIGHIFPGPQFNRLPARATALQVACSGAVGTVIPAGPSQFGTVVDPSGNLYQCQQAGTIPAGGSITLSFAAVDPGPTAVPATVQIYQQIAGWDAASVSSGVVGQNTETSQQFEQRRAASVSANARNTNGSILGAVLSVAGVLDAYVTDNPTNSPATVGGVTIPANNIYVAATGGAVLAVAQAIYSKKPPGIPLYGSTSVTVSDPSPNYSPPAPTYTVNFTIPAPLQVLYAVNIATGPNVPANAPQLVQTAIINAFTGIGSGATFTGSISGTTMTVTAIASGVVGVGQPISGQGVVPGTAVAALGTGQGGTGTYTVSQAQLVPSTALTASPPTNIPQPPRARIGSTVFATQYGAVVAALGPWAQVRTILVGSNNVTSAVIDGYISGTTLTVVATTSGGIAVGQTITGSDSLNSIPPGTTVTAGTGPTYTISNSLTLAGATFTGTASGTNMTAASVTGTIGIGDVISGTGVPTGTTILSQTSGTPGGAGVYVTSGACTSSGAAIRCGAVVTAAVANQNTVSIGIAQEPQISAANIAVTIN